MVPGQAGGRRSSVTIVPTLLTSMVETALRLPDTLERKLSLGSREEEGGEGQGSVGQFLRAMSSPSRRVSRREEEEEWETGFHGVVRPLEEVVQQKELLSLLTCSCGKLCLPPLQQCRKGHLSCRYSRSSSRRLHL